MPHFGHLILRILYFVSLKFSITIIGSTPQHCLSFSISITHLMISVKLPRGIEPRHRRYKGRLLPLNYGSEKLMERFERSVLCLRSTCFTTKLHQHTGRIRINLHSVESTAYNPVFAFFQDARPNVRHTAGIEPTPPHRAFHQKLNVHIGSLRI